VTPVLLGYEVGAQVSNRFYGIYGTRKYGKSTPGHPFGSRSGEFRSSGNAQNGRCFCRPHRKEKFPISKLEIKV
jgi:hypothetical protein